MSVPTFVSLVTFASTFCALYAAHVFGDHWYGQSHRQALGKGARTREGQLHCLGHVLKLAVHKGAALLLLEHVTGLWIAPWVILLALLVDGVSHYWADRRYTLQTLAELTGKGGFYKLGQPRPGHDDAPHLGTGAYAMDQSWHVAWLFITALILAAGA